MQHGTNAIKWQWGLMARVIRNEDDEEDVTDESSIYHDKTRIHEKKTYFW